MRVLWHAFSSAHNVILRCVPFCDSYSLLDLPFSRSTPAAPCGSGSAVSTSTWVSPSAFLPVSAPRHLGHFRFPIVTNHGAAPLLQRVVSCSLCAKLRSTGGIAGVPSGFSHLQPEEILQPPPQSRHTWVTHGAQREFLSLLVFTYAWRPHVRTFS